ncbi:MAG: hypothetical protein PHP08_00230 [Candidatus Dojkabacteria bacterium]|nr:hypothetical protein [Candidatus Dojkabacteria bacterium]
MAEKGMTEAEEKKERELLARDTRNIILGSLMSMFSSITTLYIVQKYLIPKTAAAAVTEYREKSGVLSSEYTDSLLNRWNPLSDKQLSYIHQVIKNG